MSGLKPKIFSIRLEVASWGRKSFPINSQSIFSVSRWGGGVDSTALHENPEAAGAVLVRKWTESCKEKEKWEPIH